MQVERRRKGPIRRPALVGMGPIAGVGLVEVLVALLLLTMGFLAITGMHLGGMRFASQIDAASSARLLAVDIMDRMRGNPDGVSAGYYDGQSTSATLPVVSCSQTPGCDAAALARHDLYRWSARLHDIDKLDGFRPDLPPAADGTSASATVSKVNPGLYRVAVRWYEADSATRTLTMDFGP